MRSDALSKMIAAKHTVELKDSQHLNATNIIGVLQETHTRGRYSLPPDFARPGNARRTKVYG